MKFNNVACRAAAVLAVFLVLAGLINPVVQAFDLHEDADTARTVFSGLSLFKYYSGALDYVLQRNPAEVDFRLRKMPFANIPPGMEKPTGIFTANGMGISRGIAAIYDGHLKRIELLQQFRVHEAAAQSKQLADAMTQARSELDRLEGAAVSSGEYFKATSPSAGTDLKNSYQEVLDKIDRIRKMLDLLEDSLKSTTANNEVLKAAELILANSEVLKSPELIPANSEVLKAAELVLANSEVLKSPELTTANSEVLKSAELILANNEVLKSAELILANVALLKQTELALGIQPVSVYVGEDIQFEGRLASEGKPLAGRELNVTLDGSPFIKAITDADGRYSGKLQVPYWYIPQIKIQALYYPKGDDVGTYIAAVSPEIAVELLFYQAALVLELDSKAFPGLETTVAGRFDYGQNPPPAQRDVEIYLDDNFTAGLKALTSFSQKIEISPDIDLGKHGVTVSAAAFGRYAPVIAGGVLDVTRASPILELEIPKIAMIPGSFTARGKVHSEAGPLAGAVVGINLGKAQARAITGEGGQFDVDLTTAWDLSLIGSQDLLIKIIPQEPWISPLSEVRSMIVLNIINIGAALLLLALLGFYLPGRLKKRRGSSTGTKTRRAAPEGVPQPAPIYAREVTAAAVSAEVSAVDEGAGRVPGEAHAAILYFYRLAARLVLKISKAIFKPQQTLRQFAAEHGGVLGPASKYFMELNYMVERLLYSPHQPSEDDMVNSQQLSQSIMEASKREAL
jgi:hypothetical protein